MSVQKVKEYFKQFGIENSVMEFDTSSATVELAAKTLNCEEGRIAKTLSFRLKDGIILVVTAGNVKIDNKKFKEFFGVKAKMLSFEEVEEGTDHKVGGVCPFAVKESVKVYLDTSLKNFDYIYPACGSNNSAIKLTPDELQKYASNFTDWLEITADLQQK